MDLTMQRIMERINTGVKLSDLIASSVNETTSAISGVRQRLELLLTQYSDASILPEEEEQVSRLRSSIATLRNEIRECGQVLEPMKSQCAEDYRSYIGKEKDAFERLTDTEQQNTNSR